MHAFVLVYEAQRTRNVCVPDKHAYIHMHPHLIDLQRSKRHMWIPFETSRAGESLAIERRMWHPQYIKEQHQISPPRNLETAHTLNSLSSSSLEGSFRLWWEVRRTALKRLWNARKKKLFFCFLISVYRHLFSHSLSLCVCMCVWSRCWAHVQLEAACRWRNSLLVLTPSLSVWQTRNTCPAVYVRVCAEARW